MPKSTGTKHTESADATTRSSGSSTERGARRPTSVPFGLCLVSQVNVDLTRGKVYRVLPDRVAKREGYLRVRDDSGEDYLYPANYFRLMRLPVEVAKTLEKRIRGGG